jgi:hypothetical protein
MTTTIYDNIGEDIIISTEEIFSTMIPIELKAEYSFYQKEDMISIDVISRSALRVSILA